MSLRSDNTKGSSSALCHCVPRKNSSARTRRHIWRINVHDGYVQAHLCTHSVHTRLHKHIFAYMHMDVPTWHARTQTHTPVLFSESVTSSCSYWNPLLHNQATEAGKAMMGLFSTLSCVISVALLTLSKHISDIGDRDGSQHSKQSKQMLLRKEKTRQWALSKLCHQHSTITL